MAATDWASQLAASLVLRAPLPSACQAGLLAAFGDTTLIIALAAEADALEAFCLLREGKVSAECVPPTKFLSLAVPSATLRAIKQQGVVLVDGSTQDREELADWQQLQAGGAGIDWLMVAPLAAGNAGGDPRQQQKQQKQPGQKHRVLGAVVVAGRGQAPTIDGEWLREFSCEMGCLISHASVQLMECSLEMLGAMFPFRVLEQLVMNLASKTGQVDLATVLHEALAHPGSDSSGSSNSASSMSPGTAPSSARSSLEERPPRSPGSLPEGVPHRHARFSHGRGSPGANGAAAASPFAAQAAYPLAPRSPANAPDAPRQDCPSGTLTPSAAVLLRQASRGSTASAILREVSLQSDVSRLFEDQLASPLPPYEWEVEGFEDILEEDQRCSLDRRPSMAPERAHSAHMRPAVPLEHTIAAATACMEEMEEAGGLPAAVQHATTQAVVDSAAAAAAAPAAGELAGGAAASKRDGGFGASPAKVAASVRVPWAAKPLSNPLSSGDQEGACPLDSPRKPALPSSCGLGKASSSCLAEKQLAGPSSSGLKSGSLAFSSLASKCSEITAVTAACPAGSQHWDLSFNVPQLEAGYRAWLAPYLQRSDTSLSIVHAIVGASTIVKMAVHGPTAASLLSLAGVLLMAAPSIPSSHCGRWWSPRRTASLAALRLLATVLFAAHLVVAAGGNRVGALTWPEAMFGHSGAAALCLLPLRLPLPFSLHLPLHLLCLWIVAAGTSLAHMLRAGSAAEAGLAASLSLALVAQLLIGFLLSSLLVYHREDRLRFCFLRSRRAAACLGDPRKGHSSMQEASPLAG